MEQKPIIIAGGGICGLASALAAAQCGYDVLVLEKAPTFDPIGAGLQLGPNAVKALQTLGVWQDVSKICRAPAALMIHDAVSGALIRRFDLTDGFERRFGAPYRVAHRADLHHALLHCARQNQRIDIRSGEDVTGVENTEHGVIVTNQFGQRHKGTACIAADGIKSAVRNMLFPHSKICDSGLTIHRAPLQDDDLSDADVHLWMGPNVHVVHYAVGKTAQRNLICVTLNGVSPNDIAKTLAPKLRGIFKKVNDWSQWAGLSVEPLQHWSKDRCLLLGDAAHGTLPFLAQGAAMALEDAAWLKSTLEKHSDLTRALAAHQSRLSRTAKLHRASLRQGKIYHQSGMLAQARNALLEYVPAPIFNQQLAWLYLHNE